MLAVDEDLSTRFFGHRVELPNQIAVSGRICSDRQARTATQMDTVFGVAVLDCIAAELLLESDSRVDGGTCRHPTVSRSGPLPRSVFPEDPAGVGRMYAAMKELLELKHLYNCSPRAVGQQPYATASLNNTVRPSQGSIAVTAGIASEALSAENLFWLYPGLPKGDLSR